MIVCRCCFEAIESHEGHQVHKRIDFYDLEKLSDFLKEDKETGEELLKCEWCEEDYPYDEMTEF